MTDNFGVARFSEPKNETMSQLESHEILFLSDFKICKICKTFVQI